jgi:hypothetical protein
MTTGHNKVQAVFAPPVTSRPVAHWLPFAADNPSVISKCDVDGYFVTERGSTGIHTSTFRGRRLKGMDVDLGEFSCRFAAPADDADNAPQEISRLTVWNHDDTPLKSDVVPQAVSLARLQNRLGAMSVLYE